MKSPGFEGFKFIFAASYRGETCLYLSNNSFPSETVRNNGGNAEAHTDERSELLLLTAWVQQLFYKSQSGDFFEFRQFMTYGRN